MGIRSHKCSEQDSPVYIRQKRRDLEQIATEGFLDSSWSWECPHRNSHDLIYSATENVIFSKFQFSAFFFFNEILPKKNSHLGRIWIDFFILFERIFKLQQKVSWAHLEAGSVLINILKVAENPKLPSCNFWGKNKGFWRKTAENWTFERK
jgi:hypothetical protein